MQIRELTRNDLDALFALYQHLHASDTPVPSPEEVARVWSELMGNTRYKYLGGFEGPQLVCS